MFVSVCKPDLANNVTLFFYIFFTNFIYLVLYFTVALARAYTSRGTAHGCGSALSAGGRVWRADKEIFVLVEPATLLRLHGGDSVPGDSPGQRCTGRMLPLC